MMTTEQIMMKLAQIRGINNEQLEDVRGNISSERISEEDKRVVDESAAEPIESSAPAEEQSSGHTGEIGNWSEELKALASLWNGEISERGMIINSTIEMSKKEYMKQIKGKTQDDILSDPLLYIMFRSEEQGDANFFSWLDRFPKAKNESK